MTRIQNQAKLLVVDDEPALLRMLDRGLSMAGYQIEKASNGLEALELLNQTEFDLVIMDILMPDLGGRDALEIIRQQKPDLPVLLISGYEPSPKPLQRGEGFLAKPFSIRCLIERVQEMLNPVSSGHERSRPAGGTSSQAALGKDPPGHCDAANRGLP